MTYWDIAMTRARKDSRLMFPIVKVTVRGRSFTWAIVSTNVLGASGNSHDWPCHSWLATMVLNKIPTNWTLA
jgi:hypothetical protein